MATPAIFTDKIKIGGREIPVILIGGGIAVLAVLVFMISKRGRPATGVIPAASGSPAPIEGSSTGVTPDQLAQLQAGLNAQIAQQIGASNAQYVGQLQELGSQFGSQLAQQGQQFGSQLTGLTGQLTGEIGGVQTDVQNLRAQYESDKAAQQTAMQTLNTRVQAVEVQSGKASKAARNANLALSRLSETGAAFSPYLTQQFLTPAHSFIITLDPSQPNTSTFSTP